MKKAKEYGFKDVNGNDTITVGTFHNGNHYYMLFTPFKEKKWTEYTLDANGNVIHDYLDDDYFLKSYLFLWKLVNEGLMDKECFTQSRDIATQKAGNGSVLFLAGKYDTAINSTIETGLYESHPEMRYIPIGPLTYKTGEPYAGLEDAGTTGSHVYLFPETSNIEAALTYVDFISGYEGGLIMNYGVEGRDYTLDADGKVKWSEENRSLYMKDREAFNNLRKEQGHCAFSAVFRDRKTLYGDDSLGPENEYLLKWYSMFKTEFPPEDKSSIAIHFQDYEAYNDVIEDALDQKKYTDAIGLAVLANMEEEAAKVLKDYQNYIRESKGFQEFLQFLTDIYKKNPDKYHF